MAHCLQGALVRLFANSALLAAIRMALDGTVSAYLRHA